MDAGQYELSLVIPAYNEAEGIAEALAEAVMVLREHFTRFEILAVDDGSTDGTWPEIVSMAAQYPEIVPLRHARNQGYGAALRLGFQRAQAERVAFTDADQQFHLGDLTILCSMTENADIAVGYRQARQDPWRRRFLSWGYNHLARLWLGTQVRDVDCALKVFRRPALKQLLPISRGFFVNTEMLSRATRIGLRIVETPVTHRPRRAGVSKVSLWEVPKTLRTMFHFWWNRSVRPADAPQVLSARVPASTIRLQVVSTDRLREPV
ncbi:MAG: glycosyltransferase family 2 protein [Fimbriiglobus sp.]